MTRIAFTATLEKIGGEKGGWTVAFLPEGTALDGFEGAGIFKRVIATVEGKPYPRMSLAPMGDGRFFLPVRAEIRKAIRKSVGDAVQILLEPDTSVLEVPAVLADTLALFPKAKAFFEGLTERQQEYFVKWIMEARHEDTRQRRLELALAMMEAGKKMYEP